jgi:4'-phosphopantetheinyl transferase EntD
LAAIARIESNGVKRRTAFSTWRPSSWRPMAATTDPSLQSALAALSLPGILIDHRLISAGDEYALMSREARAFAATVVKVRRASGAARIVARELLGRLGHARCELLKAPSGAPIWPTDIVGSLAHDSRVAVAAVAMRHEVGALGVDVEPAEPLPSDLLDMVMTPQERTRMDRDPYNCDRYNGRLHFVAKEAVYKAVYPLDQMFLEHHDVEINFTERRATTRNGRIVELRFCISTHLIVLAYSPAA